MLIRTIIFSAALIGTLAACGHVDEYERHVYDHEPVYCYKSLAGTQCYREPKHSDARRLVNYFGPHPSRYEKPEPVPVPTYKAPEMVNYWVKDPEPVPRPMAVGNLSDRPWLTEEGKAEAIATQAFKKREASAQGVRAFLRRIDDGAAQPTEQRLQPRSQQPSEVEQDAEKLTGTL